MYITKEENMSDWTWLCSVWEKLHREEIDRGNALWVGDDCAGCVYASNMLREKYGVFVNDTITTNFPDLFQVTDKEKFMLEKMKR